MNVAVMSHAFSAAVVLLACVFHVGLAATSMSHGQPLALDEASRSTSSVMMESMSVDLEAQQAVSEELWGRSSAALTTFEEAEADSQMDADLGMDLAVERGTLVATGSSGTGPATLAEYCAGPSTAEAKKKFAKGTKVNANWEGYGTMYPGEVKEKNSDGTIDIKYDDGFSENNVDPSDVQVRKGQKGSLLQHEARLVTAGNPANDPACKLQDFLKKLQEQLKNLSQMISQWSAAQRAKIASGNVPPPPTKAAAPSATPQKSGPARDDDLENLKKELADRDKYIEELEKQAQDNSKELQRALPASAPAAASAVATVDDLLAEYKARIADRDVRIEELLQVIHEQEWEFARRGASQRSLEEVNEALTSLEKDVEEAKKKRDELKKDGSLDPELRAIIDSIIKALDQMRTKVDNLISLAAKAKAEKEQAEREAEEAAEAARKKAKEEGEDPGEAASAATEAAKKKAAARAKQADMEAVKAANEMQNDLKEAEEAATKLDTGLHPHGAKWWRYRYEHSYIESLIMIFICVLMLLWSSLVRILKRKLTALAQPIDGAQQEGEEEQEELQQESHGTVYVLWLQIFTEQMMVCLLCFLTVWLIAKTRLAVVFPLIIKPSDDMHVPHTADEYQHLALDICTIFFFAILFYFSLMFAVAHNTGKMTSRLEEFEGEKRTYDMTASATLLGSVAGSSNEFDKLRKHFIGHMNEEMNISDDPLHEELGRILDNDFSEFPLWMYLKVNVRNTVAHFFEFDWRMWLPVMCLFFIFMICHRFAHMGYVRIMGFFGLLTLAIIVGMGWFTKRVFQEIQVESLVDEEAQDSPRIKNIHARFSTEFIALRVLQFVMFVLCYGVARMICQPWMWDLHFWPVLILSIVAGFSGFLFVWLVSPAIPSFCMAMSVPPHLNPYNLKVMLIVAESVNVAKNTEEKKHVKRTLIRQRTRQSILHPWAP